uniref:CSON014252 protein n=1 Tax=Culicoides sonorensis TaxID=179676 RepID=A0A336MA17_CULSO
MGCGSSTAQTALETSTNSAKAPHKNGDVKKMSDNNNTEKSEIKVPAIEIPPSEAFEIPFDDNDGKNGLIKRHPPKRLQRLEEQSNSLAPPTIEDLEEKLATAELRRKEYLNQKVTIAKQMQKTGNENDDDEEEANTTDELTNDGN